MRKNKVKNLVLRCYAHKKDEHWQAFCIDLCLAVQGDSFVEVKLKLENQMKEYVYDAILDEDKQFSSYLLSRKAPVKQIATYHFIKIMHRVGLMKDGLHRLFKEPMPYSNKICANA